MDTTELDALIVRNLDDLDAIGQRIEHIEAALWAALGELVKDWAKGSGWRADAEDDDVWLAPPGWQQRGRDEFFVLGWGPGDTGEGGLGEPWFDLTRLTGAGRGRLCLWLRWNEFNDPAWTGVAKGQIDVLKTAGFTLTDKKLLPYIDCTPLAGAVAHGLADGDLRTAYAGVTRALDVARAAIPVLDPLLKKAAR